MNIVKFEDVFNPCSVKDRIHIIGCGAGGSTIAELFARYGLTKITLYDFDRVESHNIANQMFRDADIGRLKTEALKDIICEINPDAESDIRLENEGWHGQRLSGYVFLCVDTIELRREIVEANRRNPMIKVMFDFRNRLYDAQHYAALWADKDEIDNFYESMNFTHEEAMAETPMSGCNLPLSVAPTLRIICSYGVANFINHLMGFPLKRKIETFSAGDHFDFDLGAYGNVK